MAWTTSNDLLFWKKRIIVQCTWLIRCKVWKLFSLNLKLIVLIPLVLLWGNGMWLLSLWLCGEQSDAFEVQPRLCTECTGPGAAWWQPSLESLSPALSAASPGQWGAYWSHWLSDCIVHTLHAHTEGNEERQIVLSKTFISSHPKWLLFIFFIHDDGFFTLIMSVSIFPKCPALYPCALCTLTPLHHSRGATPLHSLPALTDAFFD